MKITQSVSLLCTIVFSNEDYQNYFTPAVTIVLSNEDYPSVSPTNVLSYEDYQKCFTPVYYCVE